MEKLPLNMGAILHYEATSATRESVTATTGLKAGQLVDYPLRGQKLVALTDEQDGKVTVQPYNCIVYLDNTPASEMEDWDAFKKQGDQFGIVYRGAPKS
ncbi:oxaloacetate decarboxylase alpha chain [Kingella negevensis]|uniref:oxaloacetate decarboxylase alpha chain n=1 Tax=Kingella negevensis TaxID=1522312 RepID=UPI00254273D0|nr:oxaloacetate decarboxylase alpha chain [Kingella negevensis]WII93184.1 oxaloacetate decarboxylase alpha chain [Kingella negevensis]